MENGAEDLPLRAGLRTAAGVVGAAAAACRLAVRCQPAGPGAEAAVAAGGGSEALELGVAVAPSGEPMSLRVLCGGQPLPMRLQARPRRHGSRFMVGYCCCRRARARAVAHACPLVHSLCANPNPCRDGIGGARRQEAEEGEEPEAQYVLGGVEAGAAVAGLAVELLDGAGAPVTAPAEGRVKASWISGNKRVKLAGASVVELLSLKARALYPACRRAASELSQRVPASKL
jgi:hypothetical protein